MNATLELLKTNWPPIGGMLVPPSAENEYEKIVETLNMLIYEIRGIVSFGKIWK